MSKAPDGYITRCNFISRENGPPALSFPHGKPQLQLDGYTIVPTEAYNALTTTFNSKAGKMLDETLKLPAGSVTAIKPGLSWWLYLSMAAWWVVGLLFGYITWGQS